MNSPDPRHGNTWVAIGSALGFLSVALGAFGAHALKSHLDETELQVFKTGVQYQMFHALALLGVGLWCNQQKQEMPAVGWAWSVGVLLFSGSLYALSVTGISWLGAITPFGGLLFMLGWIVFAFRAWKA